MIMEERIEGEPSALQRDVTNKPSLHEAGIQAAAQYGWDSHDNDRNKIELVKSIDCHGGPNG
jgi:hypothetical protein